MRTAESERLRQLLAVEEPTTDEEYKAHTFLFNLAEARENGYDAACVECGMAIGLLGEDDEQYHEDWCELAEKNAAAEAAFSERLKGILGAE